MPQNWTSDLCPHLRPTNDSWRVDETYIEVKGEWKYLYRAVDTSGNTLDNMIERQTGCTGGRTLFPTQLNMGTTLVVRALLLQMDMAQAQQVPAAENTSLQPFFDQVDNPVTAAFPPEQRVDITPPPPQVNSLSSRSTLMPLLRVGRVKSAHPQSFNTALTKQVLYVINVRFLNRAIAAL